MTISVNTPTDPCNPSPCGPNSDCRVINSQAVCSCRPTYIGSPPSCRPECVLNSECPLNRACINQKCIDPCPQPCGLDATCRVINHSPICTCKTEYTGDPFSRCFILESKITIQKTYFILAIFLIFNKCIFGNNNESNLYCINKN